MSTSTDKQDSLSTVAITTESAKFDDIRHYKDEEVPQAIQSIINDDHLLSGICSFMFKRVPKWLFPLVKPCMKFALKRKFAKVRTIRQVQEYVATFMQGIIRDKTEGFTYSGFEHLDPNKGYLFISNHRDISLDPAFVNMALFANNLDTVKIAIGDNLLRLPVATDLMRLNKSFIVKRSLTNVKEKIKAFSELSEYIGLAIKENHNVWIAQREGRAKDGNDLTEEAILKMFYMYGKKQKIPFAEYIKQLNIVPVSITYEYDPGDVSKAKEIYARQQNGSYVKGELEDIESIVGGINGYKGHVHISAGAPITQDYNNATELAEAIDKFIYLNYQLFPSIKLAAGIEEGVSQKDKDFFNQRIKAMPEHLQPIVKKMYATPYYNQQKVKATQDNDNK